MTTKRHLLIGAIGLVKGKVRHDGKAMVSVCDELEPYFVTRDPLKGAPFDVVSLILRYGAEGSEIPEVGRINRRHSELEVAVQLPMKGVRALEYEALRARIRKVTLDALTAVAEKYGLPTDIWHELQEAS